MWRLSGAFGVLMCVYSLPLHADLISFWDGDSCDGDQVGDLAGPVVDGVYLRTLAINDSTLLGPSLATTLGKLAIDSGTGGNDKNRWTVGESWTFSFTGAVYFEGLSLGGFSNNSVPPETFEISSTAFWGLGSITTSPGISYVQDASVGRFILSDHPNGILHLTDIGGSPLLIPADTAVDLRYTSGNETFLQSVSISSAPEPGHWGWILFAAANGRRRKL